MLNFSWNPVWETGEAVIDRQHRGLFDQMGALSLALAAGGEVAATERTLLLLGEYIETHFQYEEGLMAQTAYPDRARHLAAHDAMRSRVKALVASYLDGQPLIHLEVMDFLISWLVEHLSGEDRRFALHLKNLDRIQHPA
jgi:hemerythrin